jgi:uncharacterized coiled-coil protein SlyX
VAEIFLPLLAHQQKITQNKTHSSSSNNMKIEDKSNEIEIIQWTPPKKNTKSSSSTTSSPLVAIQPLITLNNTIESPQKLIQSTSSSMNPLSSNNQISSLNDLVHVLNGYYEEQQRINTVNIKLNAINLFANYANTFHISRLRTDLEESKHTISELNGTVSEQNSHLNSLQCDLNDHKKELKQSSDRYYTSINELNSTLSHHKNLMEKWERVRLREDFLLDALLLVFSYYCVNTSFVSFPLNIMTSGFSMARRIIKFILLLLLSYYLRYTAKRHDFHAGSAITQYVGQLITAIFRRAL